MSLTAWILLLADYILLRASLCLETPYGMSTLLMPKY